MQNSEIIWNYCLSKGLNEYGAAGLIGNLDAESGLEPTNLQDTYNRKLSLTDKQYTNQVDNNTYTNFVTDQAGYGLAQWTWWTRKNNLLNLAKQQNKSIGDLNLQLDFLFTELSTIFTGVLSTLKNAKSIEEASNAVLTKFEAPLDSESKKNQRLALSTKYYNLYHKGSVQTMSTNTYIKGVKTKLSNNLYSTEFDCQGHGCCSQTKINPKLVQYVQQIRDHFQRAITISSGYRCDAHNRAVGGATGSRHSIGDAADIIVQGIAPAIVAAYAESIGIKGIGLYETAKDGHFVHIDTRDYKSFWYGQAQSPRTTFISTGQTNIQNSVSSSNLTSQTSVLLRNNKGTAVKELQENLIKLGYNCGTGGADGFFGNDTANALMKFQKDHNLMPDGIYGTASRAAMESALKLTVQKKKVKVVADLLNVRSGAGTNYSISCRYPKGTELLISEEKNGWSKLDNGQGWVSSQYITEVK